MPQTELPCTLLVNTDKVSVQTKEEIQKGLESKDAKQKAKALKQVILGALSGEDTTPLVMTVIRYCINEEDHELKKLLMLFWEVTKKHDMNGKLRPEMILVCNALRNQLTHANEYLRGATLRFLCKLRERELVQPLVPAITACLGHRVSYVRRNAVLCIHILYRSFGEDVVPDGPNVIMEHLKDERDSGALRNAFQMLFECDQARAVKFFAAHAEDTASYGDGFQLTVLSLARKVCRTDPGAKVVFIRSILGLLASSSPAVAYEAASTLTALSNAPTAIRAATGAFTKLLASTPDNNVKLVLLDRLAALRARGHTKLLRGSALDVLRSLSTPNIDIRKRVVDLALALVCDRNVEEVVGFLKKQLVAAQEQEGGAPSSSGAGASAAKRKKGGASETEQFRKLLIDAIHTCAVRFPRVASGVVVLLMDFLDAPSAKPVIDFVREACERFPELRSTILEKLTAMMESISCGEVLRVAMWILGQYCEEAPAVQGALKCIRQCVGPLPLTAPSTGSDGEGDGAADSGPKAGTAPKLLADGTYASQSAVSEATPAASDESGPAMRRLLLRGDFFLGSAICSTLCKLSLRTAALTGQASRPAKAVTVDSLLVMAAIIELGKTPGAASKPMGQDAFERIVLCMRVLADPSTNACAAGVLLQECRSAFQGLLAYHAAAKDSGAVVDDGGDSAAADGASAQLESKTAGVAAQLRELLGAQNGSEGAAAGAAAVVQAAHEPITIRQLRGRTAATNEDLALDDEGEIGAAVAGGSGAMDAGRVQQLTGVGDPVYVEALVRTQAYDIILDMTLVNRTGQTLTGLSMELCTMGDMKVVERPSVHSLGPDATLQLTYTVKVSSTEASHVYGTLVYTTSAAPSDQKVVNLSNVAVDVLNYVQPAYIDPASFRSMWADFEWENKVAVNTNVPTLRGFVQHIASITHMRVLTPMSSLEGAAAFLAANLYARSSFGEDAIMNVSVEKRSDGSIKGHIRIRAKTQGVALSLGDRITEQQKVDAPPKAHE